MAKNNSNNTNNIGRYRLGLDLGTASIGWAIVKLDDNNNVKSLHALESYTFNEPTIGGQNKFDLKNTTRRSARLVRRQVDRKKARSEKLFMMRELLNVTKEELDSVNSNDLVDLRVQALTEKVTLAELLRVLMRLSKNRGYHVPLSGEMGNLMDETKAVLEDIKESGEGKGTLGEALKKHRDSNIKAFYGDSDKYATHSPIEWMKLNALKDDKKTLILRDLVKKEFDLIIEEQNKDRNYNGMFTKPLSELDYFKKHDVNKFIEIYFKDTDIDKDEEGKSNLTLEKLFHSAIFYQRPLKWDISTIGICTVLSTDEEINLSINKKFSTGTKENRMTPDEQEQIKKRLCTTKLLPIYVEYRVESFLINVRVKQSYIKALGYGEDSCLTDADKDKLRKLILSKEGVTYDDIYNELNWHSIYEKNVSTEKQEPLDNLRFIVHDDKRSKAKNDESDAKKTNKKTKNNQNGYDVKGDVITPIFTGLGVEKEWHSLKVDTKNVFMEFLSNIPNFELLFESDEKIVNYVSDYVSLDRIEQAKEVVQFITILKEKAKAKFTATATLASLGFPKANTARGSYSREFLYILTNELQQNYIEAKIIEKHKPKREDVNSKYWGWQQKTVRPMDTITNLTNPVVINAIKQLRLILNNIVKDYGQPYEVTLEMARDMKNSLAKRAELENNSKDMEKERNIARDALIKSGVQANVRNIEKYILAKWQNFECAYTNNTIEISELYNYEVDHIIPLARGGANSYDNKVLVTKQANKAKGDRMPLEATENDYKNIFNDKRISHMSNHFAELSKKEKGQKKGWFDRKAKSLISATAPENSTFNARQLTETNYIMKLASSLCHDIIDYKNYGKISSNEIYNTSTGEVITIENELIDDETDKMKDIDNPDIYLSKHRVIPTRGKLTSFLRKELGFDKVLPEVRGYEGKLLFTKSESKKVEDRIISWHDYNEFWDEYQKAKENALKSEWDTLIKANNKYKNIAQYTFDKRCDHRHHAIDALVVALVDRRMLQKAMRYNYENGSLDYLLVKDGDKVNKNGKPIYRADRSSNFKSVIDNKNNRLLSDYVYNKLRLDVVGKLISSVPFRKLDRFPSDLRLFEETVYTISKNQNRKIEKGREVLVIRKDINSEHFMKGDYNKTLDALNKCIVGADIKQSVIKQFTKRYEKFNWVLKEDERLNYALGGYKLPSYSNIKSEDVIDEILSKIEDKDVKSDIEQQYRLNLAKYDESDANRYKKAIDEVIVHDGIFFPEHTKNKVRKTRAYQIGGGGGYATFTENDYQKQLKNGGVQILANDGYACVEIKKDGNFEYITKREYLKRYKNDLSNIKNGDKKAQKDWWNNKSRIFIGDIIYHKEQCNFYRINGINASNNWLTVVQCTETVSYSNGTPMNKLIGSKSKVVFELRSKDKFELILNKQELQAKIKEHQQEIFAKNGIYIPVKYQINSDE